VLKKNRELTIVVLSFTLITLITTVAASGQSSYEWVDYNAVQRTT